MTTGQICEIPTCDRPTAARANPWCRNHNHRARLYGDPLGVAPPRPKRTSTPCGVEGCRETSRAKGFCGPHYHRFARYGDPLGSGHRRGVCSVQGCGLPHYGKGLCQMHWNRVKRRGAPGVAGRIRPPYEAVCVVQGCDGEHCSRGYCNMHYRRWMKHGRTDTPWRGRPRLGRAHHFWSQSPEYFTIHRRIDRTRGLARTHVCVGCGGHARQWAYDHADPAELHSRKGRSAGCAYSQNIWHYQPMCVRCHCRFDSAYRRLTRSRMVEAAHAGVPVRVTKVRPGNGRWLF